MPFINDKIHGSIEISELAKSIIDTSEFQRLRRINQTGALMWVFPSANHSRFEHSVGVYYLAKTFAKNITWNLDIKNKNKLIEIIGIAGLVHDLGHLAFSHLFETFLHNKNIQFHHEDLSIKLFIKICSDYKINLNSFEQNLIIKIIHPDKNWQDGIIWEDTKIGKWIFQIVASPKTGIDVDKFDYLIRDSVSCGIKTSFDFDRIIKITKIINGEIIFPWKLRFDIYNMYSTRYYLHYKIYHHKTVLSLEILISQILDELDKKYDFKNMIKNMDILSLTDNIIYDYTNINIKNILIRIETRNIPKITNKNLAKYLIPITNSICSEKTNPLTEIKYLNKNNNIITATIDDYGLLASEHFTQNTNFYFTK